MERINQIVLTTAILLIIAGAAAFAAERDAVVADHMAKATSYEEKAKAQDALIAEHQQEKKDYKSKYYINDKVTPPQRFAAFEKHCDAVIQDATKLRDELAEFAKWHRMQAAELKGS